MAEEFYDLRGLVTICENDDPMKRFTKTKITSETKCINNLKLKSSNSNINFDLTKRLNESTANDLRNMIDEWTFAAKNDYGVINKSFFNNKNGKCELCNHVGCKELFRIYNTKTRNSFMVGCKCLLKINPTTYIGDEKVTAQQGIDYIESFDSEFDSVLNSKYGGIFKFCHENNMTILKYQSGIPQNIKDTYYSYIDQYGRILFSLIENLEKTNTINEELLYEATNYSHIIYQNWGNPCNRNNIVTFVPTVTGILNNNQAISAKYKIALSAIIARYLYTTNNNISTTLYDICHEVFDNIKTFYITDEWKIKQICTLWIRERFNQFGINNLDFLALILTLPTSYDKAKTIVEKYFKIDRETKTSFSIKEYSYKIINTLANKVNINNYDDEFANYIKMIKTIFDNIMPDYLANRNKPNTVKKGYKHPQKKNYI